MQTSSRPSNFSKGNKTYLTLAASLTCGMSASRTRQSRNYQEKKRETKTFVMKCLLFRYYLARKLNFLYLLFTSIHYVMQQSHVLGTGGFGVCNSRQTGKFEAHCITSLPSVHVVTKS